jgi:hypothetical protein
VDAECYCGRRAADRGAERLRLRGMRPRLLREQPGPGIAATDRARAKRRVESRAIDGGGFDARRFFCSGKQR